MIAADSQREPLLGLFGITDKWQSISAGRELNTTDI